MIAQDPQQASSAMRRRCLIPLAAVAAFTAAVSSCSFSRNKASPSDGNDVAVPMNVGFADIQKAVLTPSCLGCHATQFPHFSAYEDVKAALGEIQQAVFNDHSMPQSGSLSDNQLAILKRWIDSGAPEVAQQGVSPAPTPSPPPQTTPTWAGLRRTLVNVSCASCHFPNNPDGRVDLTDVKTFKASIGTILYVTLVEKDSPMPPIDQAPLTLDQKRALTEWVIAGQPEE